MSEERRKTIHERYLHLLAVSRPFLKSTDLKKINKAYELALKADLSGKKDNSDRPDTGHSIEVAINAVEKIGLGSTSIICAILHNVFESGAYSIEEIEDKFGPSVANIITGFNKISGISTRKVSFQSENFRKLYLSLVDDIRVVLIKLAHRLYDMQVLGEYSKEKRKKVTAETTYIYVPIAHRLGLYRIKDELEELLMQYEHPQIYKQISQKLQATRSKRNVFIEDFQEPIRRALIKQGFDCEIKGRPKSIHSIWNKMKKQNLKFEEVYDLFAIRIICNSDLKNEKSDCWKIYSIVTDIYSPNPKRLRDWISTPKASGYESLHTTVKGPNDKWVEVQIRSMRMHETAEKGLAAHWRYKGFGDKKETENYINQVRDILENPKQIDFDQASKSKLNNKTDRIFVFTPEGDLKKLKKGSTVLDFAYEIHTDIGDHCTGARANGKNVPIRHELSNGDKVEIITSKNQNPKMDWLNFVATSKAKNKIKRSVLGEKFKEAEVGNDILRRKFRNWKLSFNEENIDKIIRHYKFKSSIDLYYSVATEKIDLLEIKGLVSNGHGKKAVEAARRDLKEKLPSEQVKKSEEALLIDDKIRDLNYTLAKCCNPVWGDPVFGFVSIGKGISIHRLNCPNAADLLSKYDYRIIDVKWKAKEDQACYQTNISVEGMDQMGIMGDIANIISKDLRVNMLSLNVNSGHGKFIGDIKVQVRDIEHLGELLKKLSKIPGITSAKRSNLQ